MDTSPELQKEGTRERAFRFYRNASIGALALKGVAKRFPLILAPLTALPGTGLLEAAAGFELFRRSAEHQRRK
jgi:hypothetical protein